jgi:hypothetical protein
MFTLETEAEPILAHRLTILISLNSFPYNAAQIWNELPNHFRHETSLEHFKILIQTWNGGSYQSSACR